MDLGIKDKVVAITGGARGIGASIAIACAREGAIPIVIDRDPTGGAEIQSKLRGLGADCAFVTADLSTPEMCKQAVEEAASKLGRLDVVVNNAGVNDKVGLEHGSPADFAASLTRNVTHYYNVAHFALPQLKKSSGVILNIGSKTAVTGQGGTSGYACAKGGVMALTREWAVELLPYGIRVNAIIPAEVDTPLHRQWVDSFPNPAEKRASVVSQIPLGNRMTTANEIAAAAVFLISPVASHITGQHIFVDGGYVHLDRALT